jgi:hypothetical protein
MMAGRLLAFAALLFVMAAIAAAIAPAPVDKRKQAPPPIVPGHVPAQTIRDELPAANGRPVTLRPRAGDIVELRVISNEIDNVIVDDQGILEPVDPDSPAILNFIVDRPGTYGVRLQRQEKLVGTLRVGPARHTDVAG